MTELARCQWCDHAEPEVAMSGLSVSSGFHAHCPGCGLTGPTVETTLEAIAAWNTLMRPRPVAEWDGGDEMSEQKIDGWTLSLDEEGDVLVRRGDYWTYYGLEYPWTDYELERIPARVVAATEAMAAAPPAAERSSPGPDAVETSDGAFDGWASVELMGHRRTGGHCRTIQLGGIDMLRIDVPWQDPEKGHRVTQFYSMRAVYCLTPCAEREAREAAGSSEPYEPSGDEEDMPW